VLSRTIYSLMLLSAWALLSSNLVAQAEHQQLKTLLRDRNFKQALAAIEASSNLQQPQLQYWKGICLAAAERPAEAIETFEKVRAQWPESSFAEHARKLTSCLEHYEPTAEQFVSTFAQAIEHFKANRSVVQLEVNSVIASNEQLRVQFGIDFALKRCQMLIKQNDKTRFQFESTDLGSRWFVAGSQEIKAFQQPLLPVLHFEMEQLDDGSFKFNLNGAISSSSKISESTLASLFESQWFSTNDGLRQLVVTRGLQLGCFPYSVETKNERTTCKWIQPDFEKGGFTESRFEFVDGRLSSLQGPDFQIKFLATPVGQHARLVKLEWPDEKVSETKIDVAFIKDFVDAVSQLGKSAKKHEEVAEGESGKIIR